MTEKLNELKARSAKLEQTIADADAKHHLLQIVKHWLEDVEHKVTPGLEHMLPLIEQQVARVEVLVAKYGPNLRISG
jgi:hypothetical protein